MRPNERTTARPPGQQRWVPAEDMSHTHGPTCSSQSGMILRPPDSMRSRRGSCRGTKLFPLCFQRCGGTGLQVWTLRPRIPGQPSVSPRWAPGFGELLVHAALTPDWSSLAHILEGEVVAIFSLSCIPSFPMWQSWPLCPGRPSACSDPLPALPGG